MSIKHKTFKISTLLFIASLFFIWNPVINDTAQPSYSECTYLGNSVCIKDDEVVSPQLLDKKDYEYNSTVKYISASPAENAFLASLVFFCIYVAILCFRYAFFSAVGDTFSLVALFTFLD